MTYQELEQYKQEQQRLQSFIELHKQENLWKALYSLLSVENAKKLDEYFENSGILKYKSKIVTINTNLHWYHATKNGNQPYIIIGFNNYAIYGNVDGHSNLHIESTGCVPDMQIAFDDVEYRNCMVATFPKE